MFQSSPALKDRCNIIRHVESIPANMFQSSPALKDRCNSPVQLRAGGVSTFQSSPALKDRCNDEEFKGYTLYYHDPVLPDGPNWVLEDEVGLVCADDTWPYLLWEPGTSDDDVEYFERLAAHCDECFNRRLGEECDPEDQMGAEVFSLARDEWGWVEEVRD